MTGPDCERLVAGAIEQPVNSLTALALVAVGAWVLLPIGRPRGRLPAVFGLALVAAGLGSVAFHASGSAAAHWLHDVSLIGVLGVVALVHAGRAARAVPGVVAGYGALLAAAGALRALVPGSTDAAVAVLLVAVVVAEVVARRRGAGPLLDVPVVALFGLGLVALALGRTGGPLCAPDSVLQWHGAWHALAAASAGLWVRAAGPAYATYRRSHTIPGPDRSAARQTGAGSEDGVRS